MTSHVLRSTLLIALGFVLADASALTLLGGCGSDGSSEGEKNAPNVVREAPSQLVASTNLADVVRLSWSPPQERTGLTAYRIVRDGREVGRVGASTTSFDDADATPSTLSAPDLTASDATKQTGIDIDWKPSGPNGVSAVHTYTVRAMFGVDESVPSAPAQGSRAGVVTGYELSLDGSVWIPAPSASLHFEDTGAPRATVTFPVPKVDDDYVHSAVRLELPTHPSVGKMPTRTYRVRAVSGAQKGEPSLPAVGRRASGLADRLPVQWQRSSASSDGGYVDIPGVTGRVWVDTSAPTSGQPYFFRARVDAAWAEGASTARSSTASAWKSIARGLYLTCGVRASDGRVRCWGSDPYSKVRFGDGVYSTVEASSSNACAIRASDRNVVCTGALEASGPPQEAFRAVAVSATRGCGIRESDGGISCWGPSAPILGADASQSYVQLAVGSSRVCAIRGADRRLVCWGEPWTVPEEAFSRVSVGAQHVCAIRAVNGTIQCWGRLSSQYPAPGTYMPTPMSYSEISSSAEYMCALRAPSGEAECWGEPLYATTQPGIGAVPPGRFTSIRAGERSACGTRDDGRIVCWGKRSEAEFSDAVVPDTFSSISVSAEYGCGLRRSDKKLVCWAQGAGRMASDDAFSAVDSSGTGTCAIRAADGRVQCNSNFGQPDGVSDSLDSVNVGWHVGCGLRSANKTATCWSGASKIDSMLPLPSDPLSAVVIAGESYGCGIRSADHRIVCWSNGVLSAPSTKAYKQVVIQAPRLCGIRESDGRVDCGDSVAELTDSDTLLPVPYKSLAWDGQLCGIRADDDRIVCAGNWYDVAIVPSYDPFSQIAISTYGGCGLRASDGKLVCWGNNSLGQTPRP